MILDIQEILGLLPHRYPFLLIDRIVEFERTKRLVAIKNVTINEPFFMGHFPSHPVMPGVLILEAMAQAQIGHLVGELPDGLDTVIGERGYPLVTLVELFGRWCIPDFHQRRASASVNPKQPIHAPLASFGRYFSRCASSP